MRSKKNDLAKRGIGLNRERLRASRSFAGAHIYDAVARSTALEERSAAQHNIQFGVIFHEDFKFEVFRFLACS